MSFKKPFRAAPVRPGPHYQAKRKRRDDLATVKLLGGAVGFGLVAALALHALDRAESSSAETSPIDAPHLLASTGADQLPQYDRGTSAADLDAQQPSAGLAANRPARTTAPVQPSWSYPNCRAARAAGAAPLNAGEPGYGEHMDGDHDGIACEPYRGR